MKQNYGNAFQLVEGCYVLTCTKHYKLNGKIFNIDAPPNSLKDSNASPKVKTMKKIVGVCSLIHNTSRVKGVCWSSRMGSKTSYKWVNYSHKPNKPNNKLVNA